MPNSEIQDGAMKRGSITITIDSVSYVLNDFQPSRPTSELVDPGANGLPNRALYTAQLPSFTATAQIATGSTAYPQFGDTFLATVDPNYGEEKWIVLECTPNISNDVNSLTTLSLRGNKAINPSAITVTAVS